MKTTNKRNKIITISVLILLVLCLILLLVTGKKESVPAASKSLLQHNGQKGTDIVSTDNLQIPPPEAPLAKATSVKPRKAPRGSLAVKADTTIKTSAAHDTTEDSAAGIVHLSESAGCARDTAAPWVYPDPSGGLHRGEISVTFASTKPCFIEWKADTAAPWALYRGEAIPVKKTTTLYFRAHDTCGNVMEPREEFYEIKAEDAKRYCPDGMELVSVGASRFCIDRYEWPNKKGTPPRSFISLYQAMDSCVFAGKHLCTSDEWTLACTGPYGWRYPYGAAYEPHACITQDTAARPSGTKVECRGYFGVYDMAGNLAEWTNTKSSRNPQFYNVKGGFWESGPRSGCFDVRYSYYPQNRHNPVGFRCCKEALP
jgi:formylglycine-generating enzyme required for sulfatase activity